MSAEIPPDIAKAISRLRTEAKEKFRIADELYRTYTGQDPQQGTLMPENDGLGPRRDVPSVVTVDTILERVRKKSARAKDLAKFLGVSEERIAELVAGSGGRLSIPDWRGWVKVGKHK